MARKRRYLICAAVLAACVGIALGVVAMLPPRPGVTKANFDRIELGMTREQVQEYLGSRAIASPHNEDTVIWLGFDRKTSAFITFHHDTVDQMQWVGSGETILDKLCRWLHLRAE